MPTPLQVLIVEDNPDDAELVLLELRRAGFAPQWSRVETERDFLAALEKRPDIILSDFSLPQFSGLRALALLRTSSFDIPLILISGTVGEDVAVDAMRQGAVDYLLKDRTARLGSAVERALEEKRLRAEHKQAEVRVRHLNRVYAVLSDINQTIVREKDSVAMRAAACRIAVEKGQFRMAWIGMLDAETLRVNPVASAGVTEGYLEKLNIDLSDDSRAKGPTSKALRQGEHVVCNDIALDPLFAPWRDDALQRGYRASAAFPIKVGGRVIGTFSLYATEPGFFDAEELALLDELAADISFALEVHQHERERQRVEEELRWRTALFEALMDSALDGILVVDTHGKKIFQNQRMVDLWEIPAEIVTDPADASQLMFVMSRNKNPRQFAERVAYLYAHPDEVSRDEIEVIDGRVLDRYSAPVRDKQGKHYGRIWTFRDITARKKLEAEVVLREQRLNAFFTGATAGLVLMDQDLRFVQINDTLAEINGVPAKEHLGRTVREVLPKLAPLVEPLLQKVLTTGTSILNVEVTGETLRQPGVRRHWIESFFPIIGTDGKPAGVGAIVVEISERKLLEAQLQQSQKLESVGQLASGVAHDFNNILTVIQGHATLLRLAPAFPPQLEESVEQIALASERAANLTRQLLTFSRKQVTQLRALDLNEVVGNLTKMLKRILGEQILLHAKYDANLSMVHADPGMMEQVLMNLAVNARDAMPRGGELIISTSDETVDSEYVQLNPQAVPGNYVCLSVADTGCGIPSEIMPRIFEPFFTTKEVGKGTGLGLATVYGIVKQHQGWITVYSEQDRGTILRIYLPVMQARAEKEAKKQAEKEVRGGTETILLVEDEMAVRTLTRNLLERYGYKVIEADSGVTALAVWEKHRDQIKLVLTDMVMPGGLTGIGLMKKLNVAAPGLRAIYVSGYSADIVGKDFELREGINFLQKPYPARKLAQTIRRVLDQP